MSNALIKFKKILNGHVNYSSNISKYKDIVLGDGEPILFKTDNDSNRTSGYSDGNGSGLYFDRSNYLIKIGDGTTKLSNLPFAFNSDISFITEDKTNSSSDLDRIISKIIKKSGGTTNPYNLKLDSSLITNLSNIKDDLLDLIGIANSTAYSSGKLIAYGDYKKLYDSKIRDIVLSDNELTIYYWTTDGSPKSEVIDISSLKNNLFNVNLGSIVGVEVFQSNFRSKLNLATDNMSSDRKYSKSDFISAFSLKSTASTGSVNSYIPNGNDVGLAFGQNNKNAYIVLDSEKKGAYIGAGSENAISWYEQLVSTTSESGDDSGYSGGTNGDIKFSSITELGSARGIYGQTVYTDPSSSKDSDSDGWRIVGKIQDGTGSTKKGNLELEIATSNNGGEEPIYIRQYKSLKYTGTPLRELLLLGANGESRFPGEVTATKFIGDLSGTANKATQATYDGISSANAVLPSGSSAIGINKTIAEKYVAGIQQTGTQLSFLNSMGQIITNINTQDTIYDDTEVKESIENLSSNLGTASSKDIASNGNASTTQVVMGNDTRLTDARKASDVSAWAKAAAKPTYTASEVGAYTKSETDTKLNSKINTSLKGSANGLAELDSNGKVPSTQLPSFVDDVIEGYLSSGKFYKESAHTTQISGESGKIYIDLSTEKTYRWSGSAFVVISETLALGETSSTAYRGDRGKTAYDHSQSTHARIDATKVEKSSTNGNIKINGTETTVYTHPSGTNPHGTTKSDVGLGNVGNFKAVSTVSNQGLSDTEKSNARSNIGAQVAGSYASSTHTHDDRYYTESEIDSKLNGKANSSHTHTQYLSTADISVTNISYTIPANTDAGWRKIARISYKNYYPCFDLYTSGNWYSQGKSIAHFQITERAGRVTINQISGFLGYGIARIRMVKEDNDIYVLEEYSTKSENIEKFEFIMVGHTGTVEPLNGVIETNDDSVYKNIVTSDVVDIPSGYSINSGNISSQTVSKASSATYADNASTVNGHTVNSDVPANAKFTDTVYDDTEVKESIEDLNSNLDGLKFGEVAGGKNLFDFDVSKIDLIDVEYRNGVYTNKITDSKTFFNAYIDYWNDDGYMRGTPNELFSAYVKGRYRITGKIIEGCTKIRLKHNGSTSDIVFFIAQISYFGLKVGDTFTISIDVDEYNPSNVGGLIVKNIQIEKGTQATEYEQYIPSVKMLAEDVSAQNESLADYGLDNVVGNITQGSIYSATGAINAADTTRVVTSELHPCKNGDVITIKRNSNVKFYMYLYNSDGTVKSGTSWDSTSDTYKITHNGYYRVMFAFTDDSIISPISCGNIRLYQNSTIDSLKNDLGGKANSSHTHTKSQITDFPTSMPANGGNSTTVNGHTVNSDVPANAKFTDTIYNDENIKKFLPIFGTTYGRGEIDDALNVDLTLATGDANKVGYVYKGNTSNLPDDIEWGIREIFYYNSAHVIVKIVGWDNKDSQITTWYNIYSVGTWVGWTKQLTDKGGQMNGELKLSYGSSVANGAYVPSSTTISDLCSELSKSSGCSGSVSLVKCTWNNVVIPAGWYNYLYIPHRTGGKNGAENGNNHQYGTLLLFGMTTVSQCFRVAWINNKIASIEMILSASDGFSDTLLASRTGRLYVYSNTKGDVVTTNGRSAINNTGAKSIIFKGTLGLPMQEPKNLYGGHMIISVEGKGSWLDNDANDNWGLAEDPLTYITPCGNTVYIYHMDGSWQYSGYPTSFVTLANGDQYSITDSCGFFGDGYSENYRYFKLMLSIADTVLFNSSYNSLQNVNIRQLSEGVKSLYPSKATNSNITLGSNSLHYFIANSGTAYRPENGCILHAAWNTNGWDKQLMLGDSRLWYRSQSDGTWGDWVRVADSKYGLNYNGSYNLISHNTSTQTMYSYGAINETGLTGTNIGNTTYNTRINSNRYMYLYSTGKISANQNILIASDEKVKDFSNNLETDYDSLIKIFDIIQPKSYKYKYSKLNSESIGFCAQEVEDAFKSENIDPSKYSVLNIQYNYMMSRGDTEEDFKYYTKFMEISYNDLYNLAILKIKDMEEKHMNKLNNLEERLSALESKEVK